MNRSTLLVSVFVLVAGLAVSTTALGQDAPAPTPPAPPSAPAAPASPRDGGSLLGGPKVTQAPAAITLVERDAAGRLVRLTERPEAAAVRKLKLDESTKASVDHALVTRAARLSEVLTQNYALFLEIQGARQAGLGRQGEAGRKTMENIRALREAAPDLFDPPLRQTLGTLLPADQRTTFEKLVDEYHAAAQAEPPEAGRPARPAGAGGAMAGRMAERRAETEMVLREIARTLSTEVEMRREQTDALVAAIGADPEQEAEIRRIIRTNNEGSLGDPEKARANRGKAMSEVFAVLRPEQREALQKYLRESRPGGGAPRNRQQPSRTPAEMDDHSAPMKPDR
jgi:hypothetical protein